jgi:hypothetical protein
MPFLDGHSLKSSVGERTYANRISGNLQSPTKLFLILTKQGFSIILNAYRSANACPLSLSSGGNLRSELSMQHHHTYATRKKIVRLIAGVLAGLVLAACSASGPVRADKPAGLDPEDLRPGLAVLYFHKKFRQVAEMPKGSWAEKLGRPGTPVAQLNHRFGNGPVFDSGVGEKIGVRLNGFIHLSVAGAYVFTVNSNDGAEISIDGRVVVSDPDVHSDRFSAPGVFEAGMAGWYPFQVYFFQNKKTATLQLYWKPPRVEAFAIVPAEAFAHLPQADMR